MAVLELGVTLLHPWGSNVSAGLWFALYAVAVARSRRFALACLAAATAPLVFLYFLLAVGPLDGRLPDMGVNTPENFQLITSIAAAVSITLSNVIATGIGVSVRQRREHEHEIAAWAARAAQLGSVTERNRIAREMHDVVAHSLTVMVSLSDGAAVVVKKDPARAAEVLGELSRTGRTALADMRRVLGVLRDDSAPGQAPREPLAAGGQPGQTAGRLPHRGAPAALHAHRPVAAGRRRVPADGVPDRAGVTDERAALRPLAGPGGRGHCPGRPHGHHRRRRRRQGHRRLRRLGRGAGGAGFRRVRWAPARASPGCWNGPESTPAPWRQGGAADHGWRVHAVLHWNGDNGSKGT